MKKNFFKSGFTLVELMVFFIFISLIMAASTPIITKRVKDLPIKIHHGKFICYGGHYELYNATRLVSSGSGCTFTPPKRASLYKIELIGGGAGGYNYYQNPWEDVETREGGYNLSGGFYGDGYTNLSDAYLWDILKDADFTLHTSSGSGGSGESISRTYTGPTSPSLSRTKECFTPYDYQTTCMETQSKPKLDADGNEVKDEEGNVIYEDVEVEVECTKTQETDPNGVLELCSDYDARIRNAEMQISALDSACGSGGSGSWCHTVVGPSFRNTAVSIAEAVPAGLGTFSTLSSATGYGASGGSSIGLQLDGKIDFKDYKNGGKQIEREEVKSYLSKLFTEYYKKGTTEASGSGCTNWGYSEINDHMGKFDSKNVNLPSSDSYTKGKWGNDIMYFAAIKGWDACATNCVRATGGEGGWMSFYPDSSISGSYSSGQKEGTDASGICGQVNGPYKVKEGSASDRIPAVKTKTELNLRYHVVGNGGSAGSYKVAYVSSLADDCVFNVSSGGGAINEGFSSAQLATMHENLATTLVCNEGTLRLSAPGGYYNTGTYQKVYNGFDYVNPDGTTNEPGSFVTHVSGGGSPFSPSDVFTKYVLGNYSFGAGGGGPTISDACTKPWGQFWINRVYGASIDKTIRGNFPRESCDAASNIHFSSATGGSGGVIIISW